MQGARQKLICSLAGVAGGLGSLMAARPCVGQSCGGCLGCVGLAAALLLAIAGQRCGRLLEKVAKSSSSTVIQHE